MNTVGESFDYKTVQSSRVMGILKDLLVLIN